MYRIFHKEELCELNMFRTEIRNKEEEDLQIHLCFLIQMFLF